MILFVNIIVSIYLQIYCKALYVILWCSHSVHLVGRWEIFTWYRINFLILRPAPGFHKHRQSGMYNTLSGVVRYVMYYWPAQPGDPSAIRVASVIGISVCLSCPVCSLFSILCLLYFVLILLQWPIKLIIDRFRCSRRPNDCIESPNITRYLKVALLALW